MIEFVEAFRLAFNLIITLDKYPRSIIISESKLSCTISMFSWFL